MRSAHERVDRRFEPSVFAHENEAYTVVEPVELGFDVYRDEDRFRLVGDLSGTTELACSRCLESFRLPVASHFDLRYVPRGSNTGEGEIEVREDDLATAFYDEGFIDLEQLVREQFYLSIPMKPLCDEACKGLCAQCGKNLNAGPCECRSDWEDPRLAALKGLFNRGS
jgi:DUF177 domain-containing protein